MAAISVIRAALALLDIALFSIVRYARVRVDMSQYQRANIPGIFFSGRGVFDQHAVVKN